VTALPLSVRAALWLTAAAGGRVDPDRAARAALVGVDEVTGVVPGPASWPPTGETLVVPALPRPGAIGGMPRTAPETLGAAVDAGECLVAATTGGLLVPELSEYGPAGDVGVLCTWTAFDAEPLPLHRVHALDTGELARSLTQAIAEATARLEAVGGIPWRASQTHPAPHSERSAALPPGLPPRATQLLLRAAEVRTLAQDGLAAEEAGAAYDASTSTARAHALRTLLGAAGDCLAGAATLAAHTLAPTHPD